MLMLVFLPQIALGSIVINAAGNLILNCSHTSLFIDQPSSVITNNGEISGSGIFEIRQNGCTVSGSGVWTTNIYFRINRNTIFDNVNITLIAFFLLELVVLQLSIVIQPSLLTQKSFHLVVHQNCIITAQLILTQMMFSGLHTKKHKLH